MMREAVTAIVGGSLVAVVSLAGQLILWLLNHKAKKADKETEYEKNIKNALCVILYDRVKYLARHHIHAGFITAEDLEDLMKMHLSYHDDLDGNGFLDNLMRQVKELPIRK